MQTVIVNARSGKLSARWIVGLVVVAAAYLLLQPMLERKLGWGLPGFRDFAGIEASDSSSESTSEPSHKPSRAPRVETTSQSTQVAPGDDELQRILSASRPGTYVSPAGLRYTRGSQHGHRLKHLMAHAQDEPGRPGQHGVFQSSDPAEVVALVDEAYRLALAGKNTHIDRQGDRTVYTINLGRRIGYIGGESGNRRGQPAARHLRLVLEEKDFVTAFPYLP